jgi:hypothetical protein
MDQPDSFFIKRAPLGNAVFKDIEFFTQFTIERLKTASYASRLSVQHVQHYLFNLYNLTQEQALELATKYWTGA